MRKPPPKEFLLAAACIRWPDSERRLAAIRKAAEAAFDWDRFQRVVMRHRIAGLVLDGLSRAGIKPPPHIERELEALASRNAWQSLALAAETTRLQTRFDGAGIEAVFFKGAALAQELYGNLALRHIRDIDILVDETRLEDAIALLQTFGFRVAREGIPAGEAERRIWLQVYRDIGFVQEETGIVLELHWKLTHNPHLFTRALKDLPPHFVSLGAGREVRTPAPDDHFAYLCAHGALDGWFRLKWLADIGAYLEKNPEHGAQHLYDVAGERGAGLGAAQAILLCHRLLDSPVPADLLGRLRQSRRARYLERVALRAMTQGNAETELRDVPLAQTSVFLSYFFIGSGWRYIAAELRFWTTSYTDMTVLPLPEKLHFLYPVLRLPLWVWRRTLGRRRDARVVPQSHLANS